MSIVGDQVEEKNEEASIARLDLEAHRSRAWPGWIWSCRAQLRKQRHTAMLPFYHV
jgi:hypothetical protein